MDRRSKAFLELKSRWYAKLAREGFEEIEHSEDHLKKCHSSKFNDEYEVTRYEANSAYYRLASQFVHEHKFESNKEKAIWELHAEGVSVRHIHKQLKSRHFKIYKDEVDTTIRRIAGIMLGRSKRNQPE